MRFFIFAVLVILWAPVAMRWSVARSGSVWRTRVAILSVALLVAAVVSTAADVRDIASSTRARNSGVTVTITNMGPWWQLTYRRGSRSFVTANELHLPSDERSMICWDGAAMNVWNAPGFPVQAHDCFPVVALRSADARFFRAWHPELRRLQIVSDPQFDRWFDHESKPVAVRDARSEFLFREAGCNYCHTIRGAGEKPFAYGPDLTHFGSRGTIAESGLPNRAGFLYGWIGDSSALQHGSEMPQNAIAAGDLAQLTAYLESLK